MNLFALETVILWTHALAGAGWVAACACLVIGVSASQGEERRALAVRIARAVNTIGLGAIVVILATGFANLFIACDQRRFQFSSQFGAVLGVKLAIFAAMFALLRGSIRTAARLEASGEGAHLRRLLLFNGAIAVSGGIALLLGLWLMGS